MCQKKEKKDHNWYSVHSWSVIDLKEQKFHSHYGQSCKHCEADVQPRYRDVDIRAMAERACSLYLRRVGQEGKEGGGLQHGGRLSDHRVSRRPHDQDRCGMCRRQGDLCTKLI